MGDGALRWRQQLPYSLDTTAKLLLDDGTLYAVSGANLTALRTVSGATQWQFGLAPGLGEPIKDIFLAGNTLLVWSPSMLDGLDAGSGHALWQVNAPVQDGQASSITNDTFFGAVGPTGGDVGARSLQDGHQLWQHQSGDTFVSLLADGGTLYLETRQGEVDALHTTNGKLLWQYHGASGDLSLYLANHGLYLVGKDSGEVVALDPAKGTQLWHLAVGNSISAVTVS